MTRFAGTSRLPTAALATLLAASAGLHAHHAIAGSRTFWIGVTLLMAAFSLTSSLQLLGRRATAVFFVSGTSLGLFFEALSVRTGFPFGPYYYTPLFGPGLLGVPLIIPLAWYVIVYLGYVVSNLMIARQPVVTGGAGRALWLSLIGAMVVTAYDLAADPFMVQTIGAWVMLNPGDYFGEQLRGFAGWTLVSFLIAALVRLSHTRLPPVPASPITTMAAAYPLLAYGLWWLFFMLIAEPRGVRVVAAFAMGIPTLSAATGLLAWHRSRAETS
jgi:putative membrane protein